MEHVDFFSPVYYCEQLNDKRFGINDGAEQGNKDLKAYTTTRNPNEWNACVENPSEETVVFQPLDHNIVLHPTPDTTYSLCDAMLYISHDTLILIELKAKDKNWIADNIKQLKSTISLFAQEHNLASFPNRIAYAANKRHPQFHYSHKSEMQDFYNRTEFRLLIQNKITIG